MPAIPLFGQATNDTSFTAVRVTAVAALHTGHHLNRSVCLTLHSTPVNVYHLSHLTFSWVTIPTAVFYDTAPSHPVAS
jgi:hypothetical protein